MARKRRDSLYRVEVRALLDLFTQIPDHLDDVEDDHKAGSSRIPDPPGGPYDADGLKPPRRGVIDIRTGVSLDRDSA